MPLNTDPVMLNRVPIQNDCLTSEFFREFNFPLLPQCGRKRDQHFFGTVIKNIIEYKASFDRFAKTNFVS